MNRALVFERLNATALTKGVIASSLTPFDEQGMVMLRSVTDQARRLAQIKGIIGIAVNITIRDRERLSPNEHIEIIRRTRSGIDPDQLLLTSVGSLSDTLMGEVAACEAAGADAVITFPSKWRTGSGAASLEARLDALGDIASYLPLPVIVALGDGAPRRPAISDEVAAFAQQSRKVIGFDMGVDDNVLSYDQDYFILQTFDRTFAYSPSSEDALFHNLNTSGDGVLSSLAYVAPHEVTRLYQAYRCDHFHDAQAIHHRLSPIVALISNHDQDTREMIYREAAHYRGLLSSPYVRRITEGLCPGLKQRLHKVIDDIGLKPIKWV